MTNQLEAARKELGQAVMAWRNMPQTMIVPREESDASARVNEAIRKLEATAYIDAEARIEALAERWERDKAFVTHREPDTAFDVGVRTALRACIRDVRAALADPPEQVK